MRLKHVGLQLWICTLIVRFSLYFALPSPPPPLVKRGTEADEYR